MIKGEIKLKKIGNLISEFKEYLILIFLVIISLILIFSNDNTQIRFFRAIAISSFGTVQSGLSAIPNVFDLQTENKILRETNIRLANEVSELKESRLQNQRLLKLLNFKEKSNLDVISAKIVHKTLIQTRNTLTLDVGESDNVKVGMPVITDAGLVGRIISASLNYSICQIIYNKDLKVSVKTRRSRVDGILNYEGPGVISVSNVPKSADVVVGDLFITSEYSNNFPAGIPVGIVTESGNLDNLFKKVIIEPAVNFRDVEEVFILKKIPDKERETIEKIYLSGN
ncbi:MAG: rod shape-determining protein MreC [Ignavibacteria bacterium]|nr:rod shape-determining protein MreC [Ignavibacteria bacterium]